jgi:ADP-L-glycero-D-manno-heptose 6-epimerase
MATIVVTGALGFIGSRVLEALLRKHDRASLLAVDHPVVQSKSANQFPGVRFVDHLAFLEELHRGLVAPAAIIHMGACSSTTETSWDYLRDNNLEYSKTLWRWCAEHQGRLIYASSAATYGDGAAGFDDEEDISRLEPLNLYGRSKHDFDLWVRERERSGEPRPAQCVGFKFFNVFGPGEAHKGRMASMVFHGYNQIRASGQVKLFKSHKDGYADGGQLRDFVYIDQVVDLILQSLDKPQVNGLFNLGTGKARSFKDLMVATFRALGLAPNIEYIPMPEDLRGKYQYFTEATMTKAARAGLQLRDITLEEAVADYVSRLGGTHN